MTKRKQKNQRRPPPPFQGVTTFTPGFHRHRALCSAGEIGDAVNRTTRPRRNKKQKEKKRQRNTGRQEGSVTWRGNKGTTKRGPDEEEEGRPQPIRKHNKRKTARTVGPRQRVDINRTATKTEHMSAPSHPTNKDKRCTGGRPRDRSLVGDRAPRLGSLGQCAASGNRTVTSAFPVACTSRRRHLDAPLQSRTIPGPTS